MKRTIIIADDKIPFLHGIMEEDVDVRYLPGAKISAQDVKDADALFTRTRTICNEALLKESNIKLICTATIGYDHIDTEYCDRTDIKWVNAPGCNSSSVQQYIAAAIMTLIHEKNLKINDLTLGIIGVGNVGSKVAKAAEALGIRVLLNDPPKQEAQNAGQETPETAYHFIGLDELLAESDIVTCHVPLEKEGKYPTYHLANEDFFSKMKQNAVFINSSRGTVTDSAALKQAAETKLSTFMLDVWEGEPNIDKFLLHNAFVSTPHIAGYSADGKANGTAACIHEFADFFGFEKWKNWYPEHVPAPPMNTTILLDGKNKTAEQIYYEAITHTYPIWEDSDRLKSFPEKFEELRGKYWIRREFKNFSIKQQNVDNEILNSLEKIGFNIEA
ncbi:MAG: 4-phosphoerythronate dehydrogenase [Tannerella sp.]|jgi:erythronate-4-phosphate dehydrogenase|nr:4-phosphoerythronate dehydrogenase [Tannerella sp.]